MSAPVIQALPYANNTHHRNVPCTHNHTVLHYIMPAVNADDTSALQLSKTHLEEGVRHNFNICSPWCCIQEISDDLGRHRSDAQVNNAPVTVLRGHEEGISQWKHLQPGDLVKVCSFASQNPPPPFPQIAPNHSPPMISM